MKHIAMKKYIVLILLVVSSIVLICRTFYLVPEKDTNLEFWIAENVEKVDFSNYQEKFGLMGGREYYGSGYSSTMNEDGDQLDPEACVIYTVTSYPDYISKKRHVTRITVTDPSITVYGLTLTSSAEEVENTLKSYGFIKKSEPRNTYAKGKVSISFSKEAININVKVRNLFKIQF